MSKLPGRKYLRPIAVFAGPIVPQPPILGVSKMGCSVWAEVVIIDKSILAASLKFYIGRGLRQDLSDLSANQLLDAVAEVLNEQLGSQADADAVMREICQKSAQIVMPAMTVAGDGLRPTGGHRAVHH
jgi:hypothetical protein